MKQSRIDFIKEAHRAACNEWKKKIEKEFPKLFPKDEFKVGDWWFWPNDSKKRPYRVEKVSATRVLLDDGDLAEYWQFVGARKATKEEIEAHLIAEAKNRGFRVGVEFKKTWDDGSKDQGKLYGELKYRADVDILSYDSYPGDIYKKGQWAEIIDQAPSDIRDLICKYGKEKIKEWL